MKPVKDKKPDFLATDPINIEKNDDGSEYIPIWQVENDLDTLCGKNWSRYDHKYSLHTDHSGYEWLATSLLLEINVVGVKRILVCSSFISAEHYAGNTNLLQTGVAEATKAGVKVLGKRFGKELNDRFVPNVKKIKPPIKARPDSAVINAYHKAIFEKDTAKIEQLLSRYDIKTEGDYAKK